MTCRNFATCLLIAASVLTGGASVHSADLTMRLRVAGELPLLPAVANPKDCRHVDLRSRRELADPATGAVADVVVYVSPPPNQRARWRQSSEARLREIKVDKCRIVPRIVTAQGGDTLLVTSQDRAVAHNVNFAFFNNSPQGRLIPLGQAYRLPLERSEPAAVPIECNIHSWERGYLFVLEHSFIGVSDRQGVLTIRGLPEDVPLPLRIFHPHARPQRITLAGREVFLDQARFELTLTDTATDVGDVWLAAEDFRVTEGSEPTP